MWSCRGIFCFFNTFSHIYFWKMIPTYDVDTVEIKDVSSMNKKEKNSYFSDLKKKFQRSIVAQTIDIAKHNEGAKELEFKVEKDGKVIDYANPPLKKESDFNAYRSVSFLRRSNEIKELLKKKQKEVFGVTVFDKEVRYCDVDSYDPLFRRSRTQILPTRMTMSRSTQQTPARRSLHFLTLQRRNTMLWVSSVMTTISIFVGVTSLTGRELHSN